MLHLIYYIGQTIEMMPSRHAASIRLTKAGNYPKLFPMKAAKGEHTWVATPSSQWSHIQTAEGPSWFPIRKYEQMMLLLDDPPPWPHFLSANEGGERKVIERQTSKP